MTELSSHRWLSRLMGSFSHSRISRFLIPAFIKTYQIPSAQAEKNPGEYLTLNEFFSRRLKPGMRPIATDADALVSPVDATITAMGDINAGTIMNVKGRIIRSRISLITPRIWSCTRRVFLRSLFESYRLSPDSLSPYRTKVESDYIRGRAYPVNDFGMRHMKGVLNRNERLITYIAGSHGKPR